MCYTIDAVRQLRVEAEAARTFDAYRSRGDVEAGGILLGRVYPTEAVVEVATTPANADRAGRFFFDRSREAAQAAVNGAWTASMGERIYLGEWHSHPVDAATPSTRDRQMILNMLRETRMEIAFLFLVVLGRKIDWVGLAERGALRRLALCQHRCERDGGHFPSLRKARPA